MQFLARATKAALGKSYQDFGVEKVLFKMFELGRLGRKVKAGFYEYDDGGKRTILWPGLVDEWHVQSKTVNFNHFF